MISFTMAGGETQFDWSKVLQTYGDPIEREGAYELGLVSKFPNYAEFWGRYILPNRDPNDFSKLIAMIEPNIEDVFNNHYGVFYQLTLALRQIANLDNPAIDPGSPLYHLVASIDLMERTFVFALRATGKLVFKKKTEIQIRDSVNYFVNKKYDKEFENLEKDFHPVGIRLHQVSDVLNEYVKQVTGFPKTIETVRHYRNVMIHRLPPIQLEIEGRRYIPKPGYLKLYETSRWSSDRAKIDPEHFAPADQQLMQLADELIDHMNKQWLDLLLIGQEMFPQYTGTEWIWLQKASIVASKSGTDETTGIDWNRAAPSVPSGVNLTAHDSPLTSKGTAVVQWPPVDSSSSSVD